MVQLQTHQKDFRICTSMSKTFTPTCFAKPTWFSRANSRPKVRIKILFMIAIVFGKDHFRFFKSMVFLINTSKSSMWL